MLEDLAGDRLLLDECDEPHGPGARADQRIDQLRLATQRMVKVPNRNFQIYAPLDFQAADLSLDKHVLQEVLSGKL